jgi:hypothetical protein
MTRKAAASAGRDWASTGSRTAPLESASAARVGPRLPCLAASAPATGIATTAPTATLASARPSSPLVTPAWSRIAGMRATSEPNRNPFRKKTAVTAPRAARSGVMHPPSQLGVVTPCAAWR